MQYHKSVGVVIFRYKGDERLYLLLSYPPFGRSKKLGEHWNFPKGGSEEGESDIDTARREVKEETGLEDLDIISGFKEKESYMFRKDGDLVSKTVYWFLAETKEKEVTLDFENLNYLWLSFRDALEKLTFKPSKELLQKAEEFLNKGKIQQSLI